MTAPNGIPAEVWERAGELRECVWKSYKGEDHLEIALALMAAEASGMEKAASIAEHHDGCGHASAWNQEQCGFYDAGQLDASLAIATAIRNTITADSSPAVSKPVGAANPPPAVPTGTHHSTTGERI